MPFEWLIANIVKQQSKQSVLRFPFAENAIRAFLRRMITGSGTCFLVCCISLKRALSGYALNFYCMESVTNLCLHKKRSYPSRITAFFRKRLLRLWRQLKLIAAVGDGTDRISRSHLPAELADDIDHGRAAVLRELMPYGLIDLFLREDPAGMSGQIRQREELQVRKVERLAPPLYRLLA